MTEERTRVAVSVANLKFKPSGCRRIPVSLSVAYSVAYGKKHKHCLRKQSYEVKTAYRKHGSPISVSSENEVTLRESAAVSRF